MNGASIWLRSPSGDSANDALLAYTGIYVSDYGVNVVIAVRPASNLDLSSVLFASAATAASSDTKSEKITDSAAMTLRLDGTGKDIGTVEYNATTGDIEVARGGTSQPVSLVVQGKDGINDWYYSKQITGPETINASAIKTALSMTSDIDLSACKIWLEITDTDGLAYAVGATEAGIVGAPTANPTAGAYTENQSVTLTSSTVGATIYYTTDGSEPTILSGVPSGTTKEYTAPIAVTGTEGQSSTTTIKAIAVKNGMQDSSVETFTYTIKQDSQTPDVPVVTAPSITTQPGNATVKAGETATFTIAASGTDLTYLWQIDRNDGNGWVNIDGATAAIYTTSTVDISCNGFKYQCVVSNSAGTDTSNTAVLTVTENTTPAPGSVEYEILDGANTSWEQNSDGSLSIRGSGAISKFVGVKVDGNLVDVKNYTVKEGSTIVTLKADYLNTLSVGNHTFEIIWTDGTASTRFTVSKSDSGSAEPKDNDGNNGKNDNTNNTPATAPEDKNNTGTSGSQTDDNQQITSPKTGDNSHTVLWISLLGVSLAGLLSMIYVRKKKENE